MDWPDRLYERSADFFDDNQVIVEEPPKRIPSAWPYGPVRLHAADPSMFVSGIAVVAVTARHEDDNRILHAINVYIPPLGHPARSGEACSRVWSFVSTGVDAIVQAYMSTTRGLTA